MRKALIAFCLLFVLAVGGIIAIHADVNEVRDQVIFTEEVVFGDKSAVEGLTIRAEAELDNGHLNWHSIHTIGAQNETETEYFFSTKYPDRPVHYEPSGVMIHDDSSHDYEDWQTADAADGLSGLNLAYWELMQTATPMEEASRIIRIADYYDYYPMSIMVELPNYYLSDTWGEIDTGVTAEQIENMQQLHAALKECLKIPVLPNETMEIHLNSNAHGMVTSWGSGSGAGERYDPWCLSVATEDTCYFILHNRTSEDNPMDMSQLSGGFGIYRFPYHGDESTVTMTEPDKLEMVYPLDPECGVTWLATTTDQSRLILLTREKTGESLLRIIDCASMETLQEEVLDVEMDLYCTVDCRDNYILMRTGEGGILLFEETGDGTFERKLSLNLTEDEILSYGFHTTHWDGERLVMAYPMYYLDRRENDNSGFAVAVYDKNGALFGGIYHSSLDTKTYHYGHGDNCNLWSEDPLRISWE